MKFPYLNQLNKNTEVISTFGGLNQLSSPNNNEFLSMQNISHREYPALTQREKRGTKQAITDPKGFFIKNGTFWIDGTTAHYKYTGGEKTFTVTSDVPKKLVGMGAYIVIFPDKVMFNTNDRTVTNLEASVTQSTAITFAPLSTGSAMTKITASGIDDYFNQYDNVTIDNCRDSQFNATKVISEVGTDYIVVTGTLTASFTQNSSVAFTSSGTITYSVVTGGTRIAVSGIDDDFTTGEFVTISGSDQSALNGDTKIIGTGTDYIEVEAVGVAGTQSTAITVVRKNITFKRNVPDLDFIIERDNRLWGCNSENHEVYSCKLGDPKNWYNYEGLSDDAYAATIASDGDFTGIGKYSSYIIFFKEHTVHILRGDKPANYSITEKKMTGVKSGCDKSIATVNDALYYVGYDGVYAFNGGTPQKVSATLTDEFNNASGGEYKGRYYLSATKLYVLDTAYNLWSIHDTEVLNSPQSANGNLYYIDGSKNLTTISGSREETLDWSLESVVLREKSMDNKYVSKFRVMIELEVGSDIIVYAKFDGGEWEKKGFVKSTQKRTYTIPITPRRCNTWQYKLEGRGDFKLLAVSRDIEGGSDINGYIQSQFR